MKISCLEERNLHIETLTLIMISLLICVGCESEFTDDFKSRGVIEGRINSGGFVDVLFSRSITPEKDGAISDVVINWGKVTLSDGENEVILTGRMDASRRPPFRYYNQEMIGIPGKTYTLTAKFEDIEVSSVARMPFPVPIDSIIVSPTNTDSLRSVILYFTSPEEIPSFFYISMSSRETPDLPCMLGCIRTDRSCEKYSIPVLRPKQKIDSVKYVSLLKEGEEVTISLNRVEKEVYDFWVAYDNMVMFATSPFISTNESLPSNIIGGYGIWSPQATSKKTIFVK